MRVVSFQFLTLLVLISDALAAPKFVAPDESYPLLRRDLLPLDVSGIHALAAQLANLGDGPAPKSAKGLQTRAKILTLSQRLSPAQPKARAAEKALLTNQKRPALPKQTLKKSREEIFLTARWLLELPRGDEGHRLGQLLLDTLADSDQDHPLFVKHQVSGQEERWRGVIAPLADFQNGPIEPAEIAEDSNGPNESTERPKSYLQKALLTKVPMWVVPKDAKFARPRKAVQTSLIIQKTEKGQGQLKVRPPVKPPLNKMMKGLREFFQKAGRPLPRGFNLHLDTSQLRYAKKNQDNLSGPFAMMLDAAVTGRPLRRNVILFARLDPDGQLSRPHAAWPILMELAGSKPPLGTRLILPPDFSRELTGLLVLEQAKFFLNYEVLTATTFDEARTLFYADGKPDKELAAAMASYQQFWNIALEKSSIQTFVSLKAVKARLVKINQSSARHLSAAYLAKQGIRRPAYFNEPMLALELQRQLTPLIEWRYSPGATKSREIRALHTSLREALDTLERRLELKDRPLLEEAVELVKRLQAIARAAENQLSKTHVSAHRLSEDLKAFEARLERLSIQLGDE